MKRRPDQVAVRELRQNLSVYLERVIRGETLEVTSHGQPVAHLAPIQSKPGSHLDALIASGQARPPRRSLASLLPPEGPVTTLLSDALRQMRDEEDR
jgi:prevent-host-death family protein